MKIQIVVETATKSFKSNIQELDSESVEELRSYFEKIKELGYFRMTSKDNISYYFHPNQIVAIGIKIIED